MNDGDPMDGSEIEERRCGAETRDGTPCERSPIPGGNRCHLHGGASPQAQRKAKQRLLAAADPAAAALVKIVKDEETKPRDRIRAAKEILDRVGIKGGTEVDLSTDPKVERLTEALQAGYAESKSCGLEE